MTSPISVATNREVYLPRPLISFAKNSAPLLSPASLSICSETSSILDLNVSRIVRKLFTAILFCSLSFTVFRNLVPPLPKRSEKLYCTPSLVNMECILFFIDVCTLVNAALCLTRSLRSLISLGGTYASGIRFALSK